MRWTAPRRCNCPHLIRHGFAVPPPLKGEAFLRLPFIKIPQKFHPILATAGNLWYCYGATPKEPKAGTRFFICRNMQMKCFAGPVLAKQMQRRMEK